AVWVSGAVVVGEAGASTDPEASTERTTSVPTSDRRGMPLIMLWRRSLQKCSPSREALRHLKARDTVAAHRSDPQLRPELNRDGREVECVVVGMRCFMENSLYSALAPLSSTKYYERAAVERHGLVARLILIDSWHFVEQWRRHMHLPRVFLVTSAILACAALGRGPVAQTETRG